MALSQRLDLRQSHVGHDASASAGDQGAGRWSNQELGEFIEAEVEQNPTAGEG